jgi:hypothetical protein
VTIEGYLAQSKKGAAQRTVHTCVLNSPMPRRVCHNRSILVNDRTNSSWAPAPVGSPLRRRLAIIRPLSDDPTDDADDDARERLPSAISLDVAGSTSCYVPKS